MENIISASFIGLIAAAGIFCPVRTTADIRPQISQRELITDFDHRVDKYVSMRRLLQAVLPPAGASASRADVARVSAMLRETVRRGRANAREGDIFTPAIGDYFRWLIGNACDEDVAAMLEATAGERESAGRAQINSAWPGIRFTRLPQAILEGFPPLPSELEYRFVRVDLVLWDRQLDLIIDVLRDALPPENGD